MLLTACSTDSATGANTSAASNDRKTSNEREGPALSGPATDESGLALGQLQANENLNLNLLINKTPEEVDAVLGEPKATGSDRISCVRFVPERVFFACEQSIRAYDHPAFEEIRVEFEDGYSALVAVSGLPGTGEFDPDAALASVGVSLPEKPRHDNPTLGIGGEPGDVVDRWYWGNSSARLRIDDLEHRVQLSVVNGEWRRSKLEIILNHPLNPDQKARIKLPRNAPAPASESTPGPDSNPEAPAP